MRFNLTKTIVSITLGAALLFSREVKAQEFTEIFKAPEEDINTYLGSYIRPFMLSFSNGMAGGWYNTAKPHKPLGFDLTFTVNVANVPKIERSFDFQQLTFNNLFLVPGSSKDIPTLIGGETTSRLFLAGSYEAPDGNTYTYTATTFDAPAGFDLESVPKFLPVGVPAPMIQLGIGLIKNTDLKIRYAKVSATEGSNAYSMNLLGFGILHDFKQWIPGIKQVPIDMAIFVGWSNMKTTVDINESVPNDYDADMVAEMKVSTTTFQVLISKKLSIFTPYFGIGYNNVSSSFTVDGTFTNFTLRDINNNPLVLTDPVDLEFKGANSLRTTLGFRLKFAVFTLHTDYTLQKYNTLTVGLGLSVR